MGASDFETKDSGHRAHFESGMQRDTEDGKPRFDLMVPLDVPYEEQMITRLAALYGRGAVKYESRNWEQANSRAEIDRMKSSAFRHFMQLLCGETDEDHAAAVIFNIIAWQTTEYKIARDEEYFAAVADRIIGNPSPTAAPTRDLSANLRDPMREPQGPSEVSNTLEAESPIRFTKTVEMPLPEIPEPDGSDCEPRFDHVGPIVIDGGPCNYDIPWIECDAKNCKRRNHGESGEVYVEG